MDLAYMAKLEQAASAPDDCFPSMLFDPMMNDFGDIYFKLDASDYGSDAALVDPRFTNQAISRIRGTAKNVAQYLDWVGLWDDYIAYLTEKYGSLEMATELKEAGLINDPIPSINHRPYLKKGKLRRLFVKEGVVPSFMASGVSLAETVSYMKELCDSIPEEEHDEEPDIEWAKHHKLSKSEKALIARNTDRYRRKHRLEILVGGSAMAGISSNTDFIDHYYADMQRGAYDTRFSPGTAPSLAEQFAAMEDKKYWHEGQIISEERRLAGADAPYYNGSYIKNADVRMKEMFSKYLMEHFGVSLTGIMQNKGAKRKAIKAQRAIDGELGYEDAMSSKKKKKLKKKQERLEQAIYRSTVSDQRLSDVLINNKVLLNGGVLRFEDGRMDYDDDDD